MVDGDAVPSVIESPVIELRPLADRLAILDLVADLAWGPDLLDAPRYRRCFADRVEIVNPTFDGSDHPDGTARDVTGDEWARSVLDTQGRYALRRHTLTSPSITLDGDSATVLVHQHARFAGADGVPDDGGVLEVAGPLRLTLRRKDRWRIVRLHFEVREQRGDAASYRQLRREPA